MKVISLENVKKEKKYVECPHKDFVSNRFLLANDNMGYTITKTVLPKNNNTQIWHYKNHLESCYCIKGKGILINLETNEKHIIKKDVLYVLDKHEKHRLIIEKDMELICVFNPPLTGKELHKKDGSYGVQ